MAGVGAVGTSSAAADGVLDGITIVEAAVAVGAIGTEREIGSNLFLNVFWWLNCPTQIIGLTSLL